MSDTLIKDDRVRWEYCNLVSIPGEERDEFCNRLNTPGFEGFELVSITESNNLYTAWMKRKYRYYQFTGEVIGKPEEIYDSVEYNVR